MQITASVKSFIFLACLLLSQSSWALLVNGGFDDTGAQGQYIGQTKGKDLSSLTRWDVYRDIPGWTTVKGPGIEIQRHRLIVPAHSGNYYVELDSHGGRDTNSTMEQVVYLDAGNYSLSFFYRGRTNKGGDDNGIRASIFDELESEIASTSVSLKRKQQNSWEEYTLDFTVAGAGLYAVQFSAFGKDNSLGGFVDTVSLAAVPEPATLGLMIAGLLGFGATARKRKA